MMVCTQKPASVRATAAALAVPCTQTGGAKGERRLLLELAPARPAGADAQAVAVRAKARGGGPQV